MLTPMEPSLVTGAVICSGVAGSIAVSLSNGGYDTKEESTIGGLKLGGSVFLIGGLGGGYAAFTGGDVSLLEGTLLGGLSGGAGCIFAVGAAGITTIMSLVAQDIVSKALKLPKSVEFTFIDDFKRSTFVAGSVLGAAVGAFAMNDTFEAELNPYIIPPQGKITIAQQFDNYRWQAEPLNGYQMTFE